MARRLTLDLTVTQVRAVRDAAERHAGEASADDMRQRWLGIVREANRALEFAVKSRTRSES